MMAIHISTHSRPRMLAVDIKLKQKKFEFFPVFHHSIALDKSEVDQTSYKFDFKVPENQPPENVSFFFLTFCILFPNSNS